MKQLSSSQIIWKGYQLVNIPITIIIFSVFFLVISYTNFGVSTSIIIGGAVGWIYWEFAVVKWIRWSLKNNVEKQRLHKIGVNSLLLWKRDIKKIEKISSEIDSENNDTAANRL